MEWDALLADLESRFDAERRAELAAAGADLAEAELAGIRILDRLRNAVGAELHMRTLSGFAVDGRLLRADGEIVVIDEGEGLRTLVPVRAIAVVSPLPGPAPAPDPPRGGWTRPGRGPADPGASGREGAPPTRGGGGGRQALAGRGRPRRRPRRRRRPGLATGARAPPSGTHQCAARGRGGGAQPLSGAPGPHTGRPDAGRRSDRAQPSPRPAATISRVEASWRST